MDFSARRFVAELRQLRQPLPRRRDPLNGGYLLHPVLPINYKICDEPLWSTSFRATPPAITQRFLPSRFNHDAPSFDTAASLRSESLAHRGTTAPYSTY